MNRKISPSNAFITPGPGQYEESLKTNTLGNYISSHYSNTWKIKFDGPERFKVNDNGFPAPGQYEAKTMFTKTGLQFTSKFNSNIAKSMGIRPNTFYQPFKKNSSPGPGSYDVFSDFNGYTDKIQRCKCGRKLGHPNDCNASSIRYSKTYSSIDSSKISNKNKYTKTDSTKMNTKQNQNKRYQKTE